MYKIFQDVQDRQDVQDNSGLNPVNPENILKILSKFLPGAMQDEISYAPQDLRWPVELIERGTSITMSFDC